MKRKLVVFLSLLMAGTVVVNAQPGGGNFQRPSVEDRVKRVHGKIDSAFHLDAAKLILLDSTFAGYYRAQDAKRDEMRAAGADRETMMAGIKVLTDARDEKLKGILTEEQFKTWKEQIEPTLRGGGGPRPPGN